MIGDEKLVSFLQQMKASGETIEKLISTTLTEHFLFVPTKARYFIPASPEDFHRGNQMVLYFPDDMNRRLAFLLISSNVFYWHWRVFGDGFDVTSRDVLKFPLPTSIINSPEIDRLSSKLLATVPECRVTKLNAGKLIANLNFNKRMDILLEIDDWIVSSVAPDLELPRGVFAQSKSNSFLQQLEIVSAEQDESDFGES